MNPHDWYVENRAAFVSRALEPDEERTFREHLARCEECLLEDSAVLMDDSTGLATTGSSRRPGPCRDSRIVHPRERNGHSGAHVVGLP